MRAWWCLAAVSFRRRGVGFVYCFAPQRFENTFVYVLLACAVLHVSLLFFVAGVFLCSLLLELCSVSLVILLAFCVLFASRVCLLLAFVSVVLIQSYWQ